MKMMPIVVVDGINHGISKERVAVLAAIYRQEKTNRDGSVGIISEEYLVTLGFGKINIMLADFP